MTESTADTPESSVDTLVVGAGPYGLSLSAHLRRAGVDHLLLGRTMDAWKRMPRGMALRSPARASSLSDPDRTLTIEAFHAERGMPLNYPVPLVDFLEYGRWFVERSGVEADERLVRVLERRGEGFAATLDDGAVIRARHVVLATGAESFRWRPPEFRDLPDELVSHGGDHRDLGVYAGKELAILGAGQSGVEYAALAHEQGAKVQLVFRAREVRWLTRSARLHANRLLSSLLYAPADVGPAGLSRVVSAPELFRRLPVSARRKAVARCTRPAAAAWLIDRTQAITVHAGAPITAVKASAGRVRIERGHAPTVEADHLVLATGYSVELARYEFLAPELLAAVTLEGGFPRLRRGMRSSVEGLYFVGWPATGTYGPLMRHVAGVDFTARAVTASVLGAGAGRDRSYAPDARSDRRAVLTRLGGRRLTRQYHFDAPTYLSQASANIPHYRELQRAVAEAGRDRETNQVLDLGIGTGETAAAVLEVHPNALITGVDASPAMLAVAQTRLPAQSIAQLLVGRLQQQLPGGEFDLVVSSLAIHHLSAGDKRELFRRIHSVLAPGGCFVMGDIVRPDRPEDAQTPISRIHDRPDRAHELERWLEDSGFEVTVSWSRADLIVLRAAKTNAAVQPVGVGHAVARS
jgi:FAD-dependent urate hydroxylase